MKRSFFIKSYFPIHFIVLGGGLILISIFSIPDRPVLAIICLLFGILLTSSHYRINIDLRRKVYHDFLWILGFKKGDKVFFEDIENIYITSSSQNQEWGSISVRFHGKASIYYAFIKFTNGQKMLLKESSFKSDLKRYMTQFANQAKVELRDLTNFNN